MKYVDVLVGFREIPDEICLCINISNCPNNCPGCHSDYLKEDIGEILDCDNLINLIDSNRGVTCVAFMGGDKEPCQISILADVVKATYDNLKVAWYSGKSEIPDCISSNLHNFDYIKLGPYIEEKGGLNNPNTNQRLYEVNRLSKIPEKWDLKDITYKFWK